MEYQQVMSNLFAKRINWVAFIKDTKKYYELIALIVSNFYKDLLYANKQFELSIDHHKR